MKDHAQSGSPQAPARQPSGFSLRALAGGSFVVVTLCLGLAVTYAVDSLQQLGARSERLLSSGVTTTRLIEQLAERITEVERAARQFVVVGSSELRRIYRQRESALLDVMDSFEAQDNVSSVTPAVQELRVLLNRIDEALDQSPASLQEQGTFAAMNDIAQRARYLAEARFDTELLELQNSAARVRSALIALTIAVIVTTLLASLAFARLVGRPMREITTSINQLGRAELDDPIRISGPRDLQAIGISLDWLRRRIADLESQKSTFVRHMSHELKSPLANIRAGIDLLKERENSPDDRDEIAAIVERNAARLQGQIDDLLRYAGWQDAQPPQQPVPIRVDELIRRSVEELKPEAHARGIVLSTNLAPLHITAAREQIRSVVDNLIGNAIKYSPDNGQVNVLLHRRNDQVIVEVDDQGPGIPPDLHQRIFEPFYRGPESAATKGTGVGLSLAAAAVHAHGGTIEVVDKQDGGRFRVTLPLAGQD